jgi:hypothetical protein
MPTYVHASSGIQIYDPNVRTVQNIRILGRTAHRHQL